MSRAQIPVSKKGTKAMEHALAINAIDPGRYKMVKKGKKIVPVYVAKLNRELKRRCTGTNRITGLQCGKPPLKGAKVCREHGGTLPVVRKAAEVVLREARERLLDEVDPTINALVEIRDQRVHMPSALGAATQIMNRTMGKPGEGEAKKNGAGKLTIKIGVGIMAMGRKDAGALPESTIEAVVTDAETE